MSIALTYSLTRTKKLNSLRQMVAHFMTDYKKVGSSEIIQVDSFVSVENFSKSQLMDFQW